MSAIAAQKFLVTLARRLGVIDRVVDELGVDLALEIGELSLVFDAEVSRQTPQAVRGACESRG